MRVEFNKIGAERKALITAISEILGTKPKYMGMPSAAYDFGGLIVDKTGALNFEENIFPKDIEDLLQNLADRGFTAENSEILEQGEEVATDPEETPQGESVGLTIAIPLENVLVGNLTKILESKGGLIKKALGIDDIRIEVDSDKVSFPWFTELPDADTCRAYQNFIIALCKMSRVQKRINSTEKEVTNEKYAFRCFLLRLGFIGEEYKADRKILLKNLSGSSAFKNGAKKEEPQMKIYRVELDDDNFKTFEAKDDFEAQMIGDRIAEELGSDFCDVIEEEA